MRAFASLVICFGLTACQEKAEAQPQLSPQTTLTTYEACLTADKPATNIWMKLARGEKVEGGYAGAPMRRSVQTMVETCRPLLPMFTAIASDPTYPQPAQLCASGYRARITTYQGLLKGDASALSPETMQDAADLLLVDCSALTDALTTAAQPPKDPDAPKG